MPDTKDPIEWASKLAWDRLQKALKISKELLQHGGIESNEDWEKLFTPIESYPADIPPERIEHIKTARSRIRNAAIKCAGYEHASEGTWAFVEALTSFALNSAPVLTIAIRSIPLSPFRA